MNTANNAETATPPPSALKGNILIIEDDPDTAESLVLTLAMHGYGVRATPDRDVAVDKLSRNLYQVVIMDYFMPGMPAEEFIRLARKRSPFTKIVLTTAGHSAEQKCKDLGLNYTLKKPFEAPQVLDLLLRIETTQPSN